MNSYVDLSINNETTVSLSAVATLPAIAFLVVVFF
jgi:hypothetical protein